LLQRNISSQPRAIFTISGSNIRNVYVVLRINKTLQANSPDNIYKAYSSGKKNTILTRESQSLSNSMNLLKFKAIEDEFIGLKQVCRTVISILTHN
jgi:hypothetical protein